MSQFLQIQSFTETRGTVSTFTVHMLQAEGEQMVSSSAEIKRRLSYTKTQQTKPKKGNNEKVLKPGHKIIISLENKIVVSLDEYCLSFVSFPLTLFYLL